VRVITHSTSAASPAVLLTRGSGRALVIRETGALVRPAALRLELTDAVGHA